jgi:acetyltransferase-like isoleucine patch superfamily enzyme
MGKRGLIMDIIEDIITGREPRTLSNGTVINRYCHVVKGARIGSNSMIGQCCYVASKAFIGDNTRIQNGVNVWDGVHIGDDCFIGPQVVFTNDHDPTIKSEQYPCRTRIASKVTICAGVCIVAPCTIGKGAMIGAGSLVLNDVEDYQRKWGTVK